MRNSPDLGQQAAESSGRRVRSVVLGIVVACALTVCASFALSQRSTGRVLSAVQIVDCDVSQLTKAEASARLNAWLEQRRASRFDFTIARNSLTFRPKNAGLRADIERAIERALATGREGSLGGRFANFVRRWFRRERVPLALAFEPAALDPMLDQWEAQAIEDKPFAGGLSLRDGVVTPLYPHPGTVLDRIATERLLEQAILRGHGGDALPTRVVSTAIERAEVDRAAGVAERMVSSDIELVSVDGSQRLPVTRSELLQLLHVSVDQAHGKLELSCDSSATRRLLDPRRASLERAAENARFVIDKQENVHVQQSHGALVLDDEALAKAICAAAQSPAKTAELIFSAGPEPALSTAALQALGVIGLVGSFTTHHVCCQPRVENIHHIADLLDGTLVKPGETFSVNQLVGPRTVKNGFRLAPSIEDGDMVDTVGGGVSQFATTLFNALFYGGYEILERKPHSYWFTRYPMGYDATLSYPHPDIAFKNDTNAGALIKTSYTDTSISVKIYGDNGGRRVRAEVSARQNIVQPPLERIPNPRLAADEEKTREGGMIGWTVVVKRTLTFADGSSKEERRKVTYKPRARRVEVHPCKIPEGEPGHTGERCPKPDPDQAQSSEPPDAGAK
jgi:vancomycin resistance protein YoaR